MTDSEKLHERYLPIHRGEPFVELLIRDPDWAYVYWEVDADSVDAAKRDLSAFSPSSRLQLRLYHAPSIPTSGRGDAVEAFDCDAWLGSRYLMLGRPDHVHMVAVGYADEDDVFVAIARSRWVTAPRSRAVSRHTGEAANDASTVFLRAQRSESGLAPLRVEESDAERPRRSLPRRRKKGARTP